MMTKGYSMDIRDQRLMGQIRPRASFCLAGPGFLASLSYDELLPLI